MVSYIYRWLFGPNTQYDYQPQRNSIVNDTIVTVALSSLSLLVAEAFDYSAPEIALLLRCTAGGIALIWLFKRCLPDKNEYRNPYGYQHEQVPSVETYYVNPPSPPPQRRRFLPRFINLSPFNYFSSWNVSHSGVTSRPNVHEAPTSRLSSGYSNVSHSGVTNRPNVHEAPASRLSSGYSNVSHSGVTNRPNVYEAPTFRK